MPVTAIDPDTALIVIDLQKGHAGARLAHPIEGVVERSAALAKAFRSRSLPVVLVTVAGSPPGRTDATNGTPGGQHSFAEGFTDLMPELDVHGTDILVEKHARSAFGGTGLAERLRGLGVTQVVVTGVSTSGGVESTARDAHEQGFNVTLPVDAMSDRDLARHEYSAGIIFPRVAETGTTQDVLDALAAPAAD
jgi:nicotinamidase-related amidase